MQDTCIYFAEFSWAVDYLASLELQAYRSADDPPNGRNVMGVQLAVVVWF
jgi:hypothetical protein